MKLLKTVLCLAIVSSIPFISYTNSSSDKFAYAETKTSSLWKVDAKETKVSFNIVSNSAGEITGSFPEGVQGWLSLDKENSRGAFNVKIDSMQTVNKEGKMNPLRDSNVKEAFFGLRDSMTNKDGVNKVWSEIGSQLEKGVSHAYFSIEGIKDLDISKNSTAQAKVFGKATFWGLVNVDLEFPIKAIMNKDTLTIEGTTPATFNLENILGKTVRDLIFKSMLEAGCAHQKGIQNDLKINLEKVVLKKVN